MLVSLSKIKYKNESWFFLAYQSLGMLGKKLSFEILVGGQIWKW